MEHDLQFLYSATYFCRKYCLKGAGTNYMCILLMQLLSVLQKYFNLLPGYYRYTFYFYNRYNSAADSLPLLSLYMYLTRGTQLQQHNFIQSTLKVLLLPSTLRQSPFNKIFLLHFSFTTTSSYCSNSHVCSSDGFHDWVKVDFNA